MITRETDYAIRAILFLSKSEGTVSSLTLSREMGIPYRFLRRIGLKLRKCGFIDSRKGKGGGIKLLKTPAEISLLDILKVFDENGLKLNECLSVKQPCLRSQECSVHTQMRKLQGILEAQLGELTFDKLA